MVIPSSIIFSRFALSLLISHLPASAVPWTSKYVKGDDVIRYISIENKKRQLNNDNNPNCLAILVHTSIQFYEEFYLHSDQDITEKILEHLYPYLPMLRSENIVLQNSSLHHWKLSQVITSSQSMDNIDGGRILNDQSCDSSLFLKQSNHQSTQLEFPFLGFAGDYFTESNFNGCSKSARSLVRKILAT